MSRVLVERFRAKLDRLKQASGSLNEQTIRGAFRRLLEDVAGGQDLILLEELEFNTALGTRVYPDATIVYALRVPFGYWEAKDEKDDLDAEIQSKTEKGYPSSNIIYENSVTAVLIQNGREAVRASMHDAEALDELIQCFFGYERQEIADFQRAVAQFKHDLPEVLNALRAQIDRAYIANEVFAAGAACFLAHAKTTIDPRLAESDVREMLIQHILTEEIFNHVFNEGDFHRENNIAQNLYDLEKLFFRGAIKKDTLRALTPYYSAIRAAAAEISVHSQKQQFLKAIYEGFYQVYNPEAADRLGVVYTPNEIVRFMIDGADWLTRENFGKGLIDRGVHILDPCTGTGTYVCEILESFRGDPDKLRYKYTSELHANEVAILPYYVANLNIEATFAALSGQYAEFPNLCFVDTLDNVAALGIRSGHQHDLFGAISDENVARVKRQNDKTISVVIGNPPYNANQQSENDNNKNRAYDRIDESIRATYVASSTAQKTKVYDMYARFFRWASDRLGDDGVIAFVTNRSFLESRTFDGFRLEVERSFASIHVVDLGGDVRANPKLSGTKHNVFGIQTGVAIAFMVARQRSTKNQAPARIRYARRPEYEVATDKLSFLGSTSLAQIDTDGMRTLSPGPKGEWLNQIENDWTDLMPLADKKTKSNTVRGQDRAVFKLFSFGFVTNRDEWVLGRDEQEVMAKASYLVDRYEEARVTVDPFADGAADHSIKWTRSVRKRLSKSEPMDLSNARVIEAQYRPFDKRHLLFYPPLIEMLNQQRAIHGALADRPNTSIVFTDPTSQKPWMVTLSSTVPDMHLVGAAAGASCIPRYRYTSSGERVDNITDWALNRIKTAYKGTAQASEITKDRVFDYAYAVLHDPVYREHYALNLKREAPRLPLHPNFAQWADWGRELTVMHDCYESVEPWPVERVDKPVDAGGGTAPKPMLKSEPDKGLIRIDAHTHLKGIPREAWDYVLAGRSAIDWVLEQHKEKRSKDRIIRERFNTYRFSSRKEFAIDLLCRVVRLSIRTVDITDQMATLPRVDGGVKVDHESTY